MNTSDELLPRKFPQGVSPVDKIMTPSQFVNFIWKYVFSE